MTSLQIELPEKLAAEARRFVSAGWFETEQEIIRVALFEFIRRHQAELAERFQLEDIEWARAQVPRKPTEASEMSAQINASIEAQLANRSAAWREELAAVLQRIDERSERIFQRRGMVSDSNELIREGRERELEPAAPPFVLRARPLGVRPGLNYDSTSKLLEEVEGPTHR